MAQADVLVVSSDFDNVPAVLDFVRQACQRAGLDGDITFACELATDEACANVIEHAYGGRSDGQITVVCQLTGKQFVIRLHDQGQPFDPGRVADPTLTGDLSEREIGGLGLHFMRSMMDEIHFDFDDQSGNTITMIKQVEVS